MDDLNNLGETERTALLMSKTFDLADVSQKVIHSQKRQKELEPEVKKKLKLACEAKLSPSEKTHLRQVLTIGQEVQDANNRNHFEASVFQASIVTKLTLNEHW